jgi:hypothetical protein
MKTETLSSLGTLNFSEEESDFDDKVIITIEVVKNTIPMY